MEERGMRMRGGSEGESWGCSHWPDRWTETATAGAVGGCLGEEEDDEEKERRGLAPI